MAHKPFIYPEWYKAKRELVDRLMDARKDEIPGIVMDWFERKVFEVGTSFTYDTEMVHESKIDIEKEAKYRATQGLANEILKNGLHTDETYQEPGIPWQTTKKWRILVFGSPMFVSKDFEPRTES